ncbi:hypothetical protein [Hydrogenimonas sp.]
MNLKKQLYDFCSNNSLDDLSCIVHLALLNYASLYEPKEAESINLSPIVIDSYVGIGEELVEKMLEALVDGEVVKKYIRYHCKDAEGEFCKSLLYHDAKDELEEEGYIELDCTHCGENHCIDSIDACVMGIGYSADRKQFVDELKLDNGEIARELVVMNTNEEHIEKLAGLIVSRLSISEEKKDEAKSGIVKMLSSVKEISGLIAGISDDAAKTTGSVRKIVEDFTGVSSLKNIFS